MAENRGMRTVIEQTQYELNCDLKPVVRMQGSTIQVVKVREEWRSYLPAKSPPIIDLGFSILDKSYL